MKLDIKISKEKQESFQEVLKAFIENGHDVSLDEGQTQIRFYFPEGMFSVVLNINGTWKIE
jgi:hypothetical protein